MNRTKPKIFIAIVISLIVISATNVITFTIASHSQDSDVAELRGTQNDLQKKVDDLQKQNDEYTAGVNEGNTTKREPAEQEKDVLTPQASTEPFTKDGIILVNKKHPLPEGYAPGENAEAVGHLRELIADGNAAGIDLTYSWSGFRSYSTQAGLFASYSAQSGVQKAETYSARPGYSEHQTGLAFDLRDSTGNIYKVNDTRYDYSTDWVAQNAPKYGFIVRYRDEWTPITGYVGEPWHLRYLGADIAKKVFDSGKTLEEYLGVEGGDYVR